MKWQFSNDAPIYSQLIAQIKVGIVSGAFPPGERLPSVRDLATEAGVNPNTMQRALTELERDGLVYSQRTSGRYVTEDQTAITEARHALAADRGRSFLTDMERLGFEKEDLLSLLRQERCGTEIVEFVDNTTAGRVPLGPGTLYTILGKFVEERLIEETAVEGRKRTYRITERGRALYRQELSRLKLCVEDGEREGWG